MPTFNPLDEIRVGTNYEVADVHKIANLVIGPVGNAPTTHWETTSRELLGGLILHGLYRRKGHPETDALRLGEIGELLSGPQRGFGELWDEMLDFDHFEQPEPEGVGKSGRTHAMVAKAARNMKNMPEQEARSVLSTVKKRLHLFRGPKVGQRRRIWNDRHIQQAKNEGHAND